MAQQVEPLLAALFTEEGKPRPALATIEPPAAATAGGAGPSAPAGSAAAEALQHYRQALAALRNGDWQTFGLEMDALRKALEGAAASPSS